MLNLIQVEFSITFYWDSYLIWCGRKISLLWVYVPEENEKNKKNHLLPGLFPSPINPAPGTIESWAAFHIYIFYSLFFLFSPWLLGNPIRILFILFAWYKIASFKANSAHNISTKGEIFFVIAVAINGLHFKESIYDICYLGRQILKDWSHTRLKTRNDWGALVAIIQKLMIMKPKAHRENFKWHVT